MIRRKTSTLAAASEKLQRQIYNLEDLIFGAWYGLELGNVPHSELTSDKYDSIEHATAYQAVWCRNLREIFSEVKKLDVSLKNFIDIGSGKGKACFYASKKMNFEKIIGIDFSKPLVDIAIENNRKFGGRNIIFQHADATDFFLPQENNLIFMFNPFDDSILEKFLKNNLDHFKRGKSLIAYANDIHNKSITNYGFETIFRNNTRKLSLYRLNI